MRLLRLVVIAAAAAYLWTLPAALASGSDDPAAVGAQEVLVDDVFAEGGADAALGQYGEYGQYKVPVCHGKKKKHTIFVSIAALPAHLGHGDTPGPCLP